MRIQKRFPSLPPETFKGKTVWRCIGRLKPDVDKLSSITAKTKEELAIIHSQITRVFMDLDDTRARMNWSVPSNPTRYSDGYTPVVYTATEVETAVTERFHWAFHGVSRVAGHSYHVRLEVFEVEFDGSLKSLTPECPPCNQLVHPTDYKCCQEIGAMADKDSLDALSVPSARRSNGVNVPIFRETSVGKVVKVDGVSIVVTDTSSEALIGTSTFDPSPQDVFGGLP